MKTTSTQINPESLYWATFNRFEFRILGAAIIDIARPGQANDSAVADWLPEIQGRADEDDFPRRPTPESIRAELAEYGAWSTEELSDAHRNWERLLWLAAWNVAEDDERDCSEPVISEALA